jgi:hypothetical protein
VGFDARFDGVAVVVRLRGLVLVVVLRRRRPGMVAPFVRGDARGRM